MLKFNVKNQIITREDAFTVVADSRDYLKASFEFSEEWQGDITAIFGFCGEFYSVLLENGGCDVPWEVIKTPAFTVSVVCGDRITANMASVEVELSGYCEGQTPKPPTPDVYQQILNSAKQPYIGENGNWYLWNADAQEFADTGVCAKGTDGYTPVKGVDYFDGEQGPQGPKGDAGYTPLRGVDYWTEADKTEIKEYVDAVVGEIEPLLEEI